MESVNHSDTTSNNTGTPYMAAFSIITIMFGEVIPTVVYCTAAGITWIASKFHILLHVHMPPIVMEVSQLCVWWIGGIAGTLTILSSLGYNPEWLVKIKSKFKK